MNPKDKTKIENIVDPASGIITPNTPTAPITPTQLTPSTPFVTPKDTATSTATNPTITLSPTDAYIQSQKDTQNTLVNEYDKLFEQAGLKSEKQLQYQDQAGAAQNYSDFTNYNNQLAGEKRALDISKRDLKNTGVMTVEQLNSEYRALENQSLQKQADIALLANMSLNNYNAAKQNAKDKVDLEFKPIEDKLAAKNKQMEDNWDLLSSSEKQKLTSMYNVEAADLAQQRKDKEQIAGLKVEAAKYGLKDFSGFTDKTTLNDAMKIVAPYLAKSNNDFQKLPDGSTVLVNKSNGQIISNLGGGTVSESATPLIRTVTLPNGTKQVVDGYTLNAGDDPYLIAQKNGTDMQGLKNLNPNITDWNNLPVGSVINIPNKTTNGSLLAATGLSQLAMEYLKVGSTALTRLDAKTRQSVFNEVADYTKSRGIDEATFRQQYEAVGKTVGVNVLRNNQAKVAENELAGTLENIKTAATEAGLTDLKALNIGRIIAGTQLNKPEAATYKFHVNQLRKELASYNAALSGELDTNGNIRQISEADMKVADNFIQNGFAKGSLDGFEIGLKASMDKMGIVLKNSIDSQNKEVWNLFGVGDKYQSPEVKQDPVANITAYGNKHPEQQQIIMDMYADVKKGLLTVGNINDWVNQQEN